MKKSSAVPAALCAAVGSAVMTGCSSPASVRRCIDPTTGKVLADTMCSAPVTGTTYKGGRYARVNDLEGKTICFDTQSNLQVADSFCRNSPHYGNGFLYGGLGRGLIRPSWGYDGTMSGGRLRNYSTTVPDDNDVRDSRGNTVRKGFGSSSSSGGSSFS